MKDTKSSHVSEDKLKVVKVLAKQISERSTVFIASIKGLPAKQFQIIKKSLREDGDVWVIRKRAMIRAIEESGKKDLKKLEDYIQEGVALITSNKDVFELATKLTKSKSPVKAKAGQEAPNDVEIEAGVTELPAGPAVSELGSVGLSVKISQGKIEILEPRVIVKKGQIISEEAASVMGKLNVLPFSVGFIPEVAYNSKSNLIFTELRIDPKYYAEEMQQIFAKSNAFAVSLGYICKETIIPLLVKATTHENALNKFLEKENTQNEEPKQGEQA
jgi:large subunit ribosomal protein L10